MQSCITLKKYYRNIRLIEDANYICITATREVNSKVKISMKDIRTASWNEYQKQTKTLYRVTQINNEGKISTMDVKN